MVRVEKSANQGPNRVPCYRCHKQMEIEGYNIRLSGDDVLNLKSLPPMPSRKRYPNMAASVPYYRWLCKECTVLEGYIW